jgi:RHS repeat-associated protein
VQYGYDAASNRSSMTDPQSLATAYTYDVLNRLSTLAFNGQTPAFGFGYDALSRRTSLTRPNGIATSYSYDPMSGLLSVLHKLGTTTLDGASYTYDNAENRKTRTDKRLNITLTYTYDKIYQLQSAKQGATTKETYTYDVVGNRLSSLGVTPYQYNSSNELTSLPNVGYTYDNNGNTKTKADPTGVTTYSWDFENRLSSVLLPQGRGVDEPLAELRSGTTSYYDADGLGSITSLSSSAGAIANTYTYDSFGKLAASTGVVSNPLRFTGREFDIETRVYYYRARYYDHSVGRFLSEGPLKLNGVLKNIYGYVLNNPVRYTDPCGLSAQDVQNIENQSRNDINSMTASGQRIDPGWMNNFLLLFNI